MAKERRFSKYEKARMIGARALQIAQGAPFLVKLSEEDLEKIKYNPIEIAKLELEKGVIPIEVRAGVDIGLVEEEKAEEQQAE